MDFIRETNNQERTMLYYPTIKIKDGAWLRNAILYWDKVASIVPGIDYNESNSIEVNYLMDAGIYEPVYPVDLQCNEKLCKKFCKEAKNNINSHRNFINGGKETRVHVDKINMIDKVHIQKTPDSILDYLLDAGIAKRDYDGPWINMSERDSDIYMATLAKYLAQIHGNIEIGTDKYNEFYYPYAKNKGKRTIEKQMYIDVALHNILPVPTEDIPIEELIDFRMKYHRELKCFRRRLDEFKWCLNQCADVNAIQECTLMFKNQINENMIEIDELMEERGIQKRKNAMRTIIPIFLNLGVDMFAATGNILPPSAAILSGAICVSATLFQTKNVPEISENSAYLFYAKENGYIQDVRRGR